MATGRYRHKGILGYIYYGIASFTSASNALPWTVAAHQHTRPRLQYWMQCKSRPGKSRPGGGAGRCTYLAPFRQCMQLFVHSGRAGPRHKLYKFGSCGNVRHTSAETIDISRAPEHTCAASGGPAGSF